MHFGSTPFTERARSIRGRTAGSSVPPARRVPAASL
jgi:hypothetical protein